MARSITTSVITGQYVDPKAGRITFTDFYEVWSERQVWVPGTQRAMDLAAGSVPFATCQCAPFVSRTSNSGQGYDRQRAKAQHDSQRIHNVRAVLRGAVTDGYCLRSQ